jgi:hypothetical protein
MKAAVVHDFAEPLSIEDVVEPKPSDGQVLVRLACPLEAVGEAFDDVEHAGNVVPRVVLTGLITRRCESSRRRS